MAYTLHHVSYSDYDKRLRDPNSRENCIIGITQYFTLNIWLDGKTRILLNIWLNGKNENSRESKHSFDFDLI